MTTTTTCIHAQERHHVSTMLRQAHLFSTSYEREEQRKTGTFLRRSPGSTTTTTTSHSREALGHALHFPAAGGLLGSRRPLVCLAWNFLSLREDVLNNVVSTERVPKIEPKRIGTQKTRVSSGALFSLPAFPASFFLVSPIVCHYTYRSFRAGCQLAYQL